MKFQDFSIKCVKDCPGVLGTIDFKAGKIYHFKNGECIKENGAHSQLYSSFSNFMCMNSNWKDRFIEINYENSNQTAQQIGEENHG